MIGTEDFGPRDLHGWVRGQSGERVVGLAATTLTEIEGPVERLILARGPFRMPLSEPADCVVPRRPSPPDALLLPPTERQLGASAEAVHNPVHRRWRMGVQPSAYGAQNPCIIPTM